MSSSDDFVDPFSSSESNESPPDAATTRRRSRQEAGPPSVPSLPPPASGTTGRALEPPISAGTLRQLEEYKQSLEWELARIHAQQQLVAQQRRHQSPQTAQAAPSALPPQPPGALEPIPIDHSSANAVAPIPVASLSGMIGGTSNAPSASHHHQFLERPPMDRIHPSLALSGPAQQLPLAAASDPLPMAPAALGRRPAAAEDSKEEARSRESRLTEAHNARWRQKYNQLVQFVQQHGHACVPIGYSASPSLANWVKRQRVQRKDKLQGKSSAMTDGREELLNQVGFVWDSHGTTWHERYHELLQFRSVHGHCNVPAKYPHNPALAIWVKSQRRQYKLWQDGQRSSMTDYRHGKLSSIGFEFAPRSSR